MIALAGREARLALLLAGLTVLLHSIAKAGCIQGQVIDANGSPLQQIAVRARSSSPLMIYSALSGTNGAFTFSNMTPGTYEVWPYGISQDFIVARTNVAVNAGVVTSNVVLRVVLGGVIEGAITDTSGGALAGIAVSAYFANDKDLGETQTDSNGCFRIVGLPSGAYWVRTHASQAQNRLNEWYDNVPAQSHWIPSDAAQIDVVEGSVTGGIRLALAAGASISGVVRSSTGDGLSDVGVQVWTTDGTCIADSFSGAGGVYGIGGLYPGSYCVRTYVQNQNYLDCWYVSTPANLPYYPPPPNATPVPVSDGEDVEGVDFELEVGARIGGTVRDRQGLPVDGARIEASPFHNTATSVVYSDSNGVYMLSRLAGGSHGVSASCAGLNLRKQETAVKLESGETVAGVDFALAQGCVVEGYVVDQHGAPIDNGFVTATEPTSGSLLTPLPIMIFPNTDSAGYYRIAGLTAGERIVSARTSGGNRFSQSTNIHLSYSMPTTRVDFCLSTAPVAIINGRVVDGDGGGVADMLVVAVGDDGSWSWASSSDIQGHFSLQVSAPGTYAMRTSRSEGSAMMDVWSNGSLVTNNTRPSSAMIAVTVGETVSNITLAVTEGCRISGQVTDELGAPLGGATVCAADSITGFCPGWAVADTNGGFILQGLYPAFFEVSAREGEHLTRWYSGVPGGSASSGDAIPVEVSFEHTPDNIDFALPRGASISVCVSNLYNEPVAGARVYVNPKPAFEIWSFPRGTTDEAGHYLGHCFAGREHVLGISAGGYEEQQIDISLIQGATTTVSVVLAEVPVEADSPELQQGSMTLNWRTPSRGLYRIEQSANLTDWTEVQNGQAVDQRSEQIGRPSLKIEYRRTSSELDAKEFFRLRKLE